MAKTIKSQIPPLKQGKAMFSPIQLIGGGGISSVLSHLKPCSSPYTVCYLPPPLSFSTANRCDPSTSAKHIKRRRQTERHADVLDAISEETLKDYICFKCNSSALWDYNSE